MDVPARVELHATRTLKPPVYVTARSPTASLRVRLRWYAPGRWRARLTFTVPGSWTLRAAGATASVIVQPPPASTFTPPGAPGCAPPSPANAKTSEVLGTNGLWANLLGSLDVLANRPEKIVFRLGGTGEATFAAIGPDGAQIEPTELTAHAGSNWLRPGDEWGSLWTFTQPGCWQVHARRADVSGDLWLVVKS
jgi:hypothetical protein